MRSLVVLIVAGAAVSGQGPVRDSSAQLQPGSAVIAGVVVDDLGVPIARAVVALGNVGNTVRLMGATDDLGRFVFGQLPAGQYGLAASQSGYVEGVPRLRRAGTTGVRSVVAISEREQITDITLTLARGARIEGRVVDEDSSPLAGVAVRAYALNRAVAGLGLPLWVGTSAFADRSGRFRLGSLPAGDYLVSASRPDPGAMTQIDSGGIARTVRFLETFHPGTVRQTEAVTVTVARGETRAGVDVVIRPTPATTITGVGSLPGGEPIALVTAHLVEPDRIDRVLMQARAAGSGRFVFDGVRAGRYEIAAQATSQAEMGPRSGPDSGTWFVTATLVTDGVRPVEVPLQFVPGARMSARIVVDARDPSALNNQFAFSAGLKGPLGSPFRQTWPYAGSSNSGMLGWTAIPPGQYVFSSEVQRGLARSEWYCTSVLVDGVEVLDVPFEIASGQNMSNVVMRFTDSPAEISGIVRDASGAPQDGGAVAFAPVDRRHWATPGGRLRLASAGADGRYVARGLPAGDYFAIALPERPPDNWANAAWWQPRTGMAVRATLAAGEQKALNLTVR